jgi:hypothetical protein
MSNRTVPNVRRGWRIYLWLMSVLFVIALAATLVEAAEDSLVDLLDYAGWGISLVGVFGYAYSRPIWSRRLWRWWLPIILVWDLCILPRQLSKEDFASDAPTLIATILVSVLLVLPQYVALYRYGYEEGHAWAT